jgi:cytochrome c5
LYKEICQGCHLPPVSEPEFWNSDRWSAKNAAGERYLDLKMLDIQNVGTVGRGLTPDDRRALIEYLKSL